MRRPPTLQPQGEPRGLQPSPLQLPRPLERVLEELPVPVPDPEQLLQELPQDTVRLLSDLREVVHHPQVEKVTREVDRLQQEVHQPLLKSVQEPV